MTMPASVAKNAAGSGLKPRVWASGVAGSSATTVTTLRAARVREPSMCREQQNFS